MCAVAALTGCLALPAMAGGTIKRHRLARGHQGQKRRLVRRRPCPGANLVPNDSNVASAERATLCLVDRERTADGLPPLTNNFALDAAAAQHSSEMVTRDYFSHRSPSGTTVEVRVLASGYARAGGRVSVGENVAIAGGSLATPETVVRDWMGSPAHRANLLGRQFRASGVGITPGMPLSDAGGWAGAGATYTEDFGNRR
jgi:uncharacterized protein YkwD